jgi:hypothetical protein
LNTDSVFRVGFRGDAPPKIGKNMIFWRKIVIFHTKYPKNFRASLRNPGSAPGIRWQEYVKQTKVNSVKVLDQRRRDALVLCAKIRNRKSASTYRFLIRVTLSNIQCFAKPITAFMDD